MRLGSRRLCDHQDARSRGIVISPILCNSHPFKSESSCPVNLVMSRKHLGNKLIFACKREARFRRHMYRRVAAEDTVGSQVRSPLYVRLLAWLIPTILLHSPPIPSSFVFEYFKLCDRMRRSGEGPEHLGMLCYTAHFCQCAD